MVYTSKNISSPVEEKVEDILGNAPSTLSMPRFNTMLESAIFVGSFMEEAYTDLMKDIGIGELAVYESTGAEVLYEAEDGTETEAGKNLKDKAGDFFKKIWNGIKAMFEKAIAWFQEKMKVARANKMDKVKKVWEAKKDSIPDDKTFGKARFLHIKDSSKKFDNTARFLATAAKTAAEKLSKGEESDVVAAFKAARSDVLGDVESPKDFKARFLKYYEVPEKGVPVTKAWVNDNLGFLIDVVVNGVDTKTIKGIYKDLKSKVNELASDAKKAKGDNFKANAKAAVKVLSFISAADSALIDIMRSRYVEANTIATSVAVACKLGKKKEDEAAAPAKTEQIEDKAAANESAIISTIESAFEW